MTSQEPLTHGHFLLLLSVTGVSQEVIEATAQDVSAAYMSQFRHLGAFTAAVFRLGARRADGSTVDTPYSYAVRYFGPQASVAGLQANLAAAAQQAGASIQTLTFEVQDVTGIF